MTLYMLFEALERGDVTMDTRIPISKRAAAAAPSKLHLRPGSSISVQQAIGALITKSANDVALATGEKLGGTESQFAEKMTARAQALGMSQTTFRNASGLPNPQQLSTARDMATLANRLLKDFPQYYDNFSRMEFNYNGQTIRTHNRLLEFYEGADGIKTGFTSASGFNLVASATRNGYRVIGVIFGGQTARTRDRRLASLMDAGFTTLSGAPAAPLIAGDEPPLDRIGAQIALIDPAQDTTEQGDTDQPFMPVTRSGSVQTENLPPPGEKPQTMAALTPAPQVKAPSASTEKATAPTWGIQIGAFSNRDTAETRSNTAAIVLKPTFDNVSATVMAVTINGRKIYRARIVGLENKDLLKACALVRSKTGCQAVPPAQVAAR